MDCIAIKRLELYAKHGVFPEEKVLGQKFYISVELFTNLRNAGKKDCLTESIDYSQVCVKLKQVAESSSFNLIETLAEETAAMLLKDYEKLTKVIVEVEKPNAPIPLSFESVSVRIQRQRHRAFIALGSNVGDREAHLQFGIEKLNEAKGCKVVKVSSFINTKPYGNVEQDDFLNGALELETLLSPSELLCLLKGIEDKRERVRDKRWGPRTLDLDIIFFDDLIFSDEKLRVPHIDAHRRDFVLSPIAEIAPNYFHPILHKTVSELLEELS